MTEDLLPICVDLYPGDEIFDPADLPDLEDMRQKSHDELALSEAPRSQDPCHGQIYG